MYDVNRDPCAMRRTAPKVPGINASTLQPSIQPNGWRTDPDETVKIGQATTCKRFGVKPTSGKVAEENLPTGPISPDDPYLSEWRNRGSLRQLPASKTREQDKLHALCVAWIAGERQEAFRQAIMHGIEVIRATDPEHGAQWRQAMAARELYPTAS